MSILAQSNWDTPGLVLGPKSAPWKTVVPTHCRLETPPLPAPNGGTLAVHAFCPAGAAVNVQFGTQLPQDRLIGGPGWFVDWYFLLPSATLAATAHAGQIKLFLSRTGVPGGNGFLLLGEGWEFNSKDNRFASRIDANVQIINTGPVITPDVWHRVGLWQKRDPVAHMGHAKIWYDGVLQGMRSHPMLGDDILGVPRGLSFGEVWTQHATAGVQLDVWTSNVTVSDAPIAPYMQAA